MFLFCILNEVILVTDTQKAIHNTGPGSSFNTPSSVMKTFSFLVEHYLDENTSSPLSATNFRTHHNLNDKQFAWINLLGLTKVQKWPQIESLLITKVREVSNMAISIISKISI